MTAEKQQLGKRRILVNAAYLFFSNGFVALLRGLYAVVIARSLGPDLYGVFAYGLSWYAVFLPFANLSLEQVMARSIGQEPQRKNAILAETFTLRGLAILVATTLCLYLGSQLAEGKGGLIIAILAMALSGRSLATWVNSAFVALEQARWAFWLETIARVVEITTGIFLLLLGYSVVELAVVHVLSWWGQAAAGLVLLRSKGYRFELLVRWRRAMGVLWAVLPIAMTSAAINWVLQGPVVIFKGIGNTDHYLGQLALIMQAFFLLISIPASVGRAAMPMLSRSAIQTDQQDRLYLEVSLRAIILAGGLIALFMMAFGKEIVALVFGDEYLVAGESLWVAMWLILPFSAAWNANQLLIAHNQRGDALLSAILGAVIMTLLLILLVPQGALFWFFVAVGVGMGVWAGLANRALSKAVGPSWWLAVGAPILAVVWALTVYLLVDPVVSGGLALATAGLALLVGVVVLRAYSNDEKELILNRINKGFRSG